MHLLDELPELHEQTTHEGLELRVAQPGIRRSLPLQRAAQARAPQFVELVVHELVQNDIPATTAFLRLPNRWIAASSCGPRGIALHQQVLVQFLDYLKTFWTGRHLLSGALGFTMAKGTPSDTRDVPWRVAGKEASMTTLTRCASGPKICNSDSWKNSSRGLCFKLGSPLS
jgi:hypothetical protein